MAKQVEDILLRLGISGFEGLDRVKSSFRDLGRVTNLAERDILKARDSLTEFAKKAGDTEAVNKGLIEAFKGLRSQVDVSGKTYRDFTNEIARLETELRGSTAAIDRQRLSLLNNAAAGKQNVDSLQRQVDALRQLQRETRPGSSAFLQLGKDIDNVTIKLGKLKSEAQAFNLALGQQAGATPEVLNRQIATLQKGLQSVRYDAEQFVDTLRKIQLLQITQTGRAGRAGVIAGFEAFRSREYTAGFADPSRLAAMPDTTAALNQELAELSLRLDNVERGSVDYINTSVRIADIQKRLRTELLGTAEAFSRLDIAQAGVERRAGKLADIQEYYRSQGPMAPGVGGFRDPETGAIIARGTRVQTGIRPGTQYGQPIGPVAFPAAAVQAEASIKQAQERINEIYENAYIRRTQLQTEYNQIHIDKLLEGLDMEGRVRDRAFNDELVDFDRRLAARERRRRGRLSGMQLAQGVGAALSGGIFGGPEGLIGGLGGLAAGGVGGAFAGAAAGAQVGMFRQQLAGTADYAAQIGKLQIALRGIVGSQDAYNRAIAAAAAATRDLNIPQEEATRGLTRLSAAVIGAGGTVNDSAFAFRAMSEAVKATGGNAEQVDGALLALTQVFSKGKVSAEELNQIAERLPGTFTLFAQAAGKSGPELQKALEQGQVGLNDLVRFLDLLSKRYSGSAQLIATSSEDAGARLQVAFKAMQLEVGRALQPLGAEFQDAFTEFLVTITPALVESTRLISQGFKLLGEGTKSDIDLLRNSLELLNDVGKLLSPLSAGLEEVGKVVKGLGLDIKTGIPSIQQGMQQLLNSINPVKAALDQIIAARKLLKGEQATPTRPSTPEGYRVVGGQLAYQVPGIGWVDATTGKPLFQSNRPGGTKFPDPSSGDKGAESAAKKAAREAEQRAAQQQRELETAQQQQIRVADAVFKHQIELDRQRFELQKRLDDLQAENRIARETGVSREIVSSFEQLRQRLRDIDERSAAAAQRTALARQTLTSAQQQAAVTAGPASAGGRGLPGGIAGYISGDPRSPFYRADHGGANYHEHISFVSRKAAEEAYNKLIKAGIKVTEFQGYSRVGRHTPGSAHYSGLAFDVPGAQVPIGQESQLTARVKALLGVGRTPTGVAAQRLRAMRTAGTAGVEAADLTAAQQAEAGITAAAQTERATTLTNFILNQTSALREQNATQQRNNELQAYRNTLNAQFADSGYVDLQIKLKEEQLKQAEAQATYNRLIAENPALSGTLAPALEEINTQYATQARLLTDAYNAQQLLNGSMSVGFTTGASQYLQSLGTLNQATAQLTQTGFKGIEDAIFSLATTGTANFADFAASILRDTARMIIQQFVLKSIMGVLGFGGGPIAAVGNPTAPGGDVMGAIGRLLGNANGNAYATNGIVPYAMGGLVTKPTLFRYANGGVPATGLMGEAGPEAIMPLRRLPNGRLGVESASSGGAPTIIVNVDAKGTSVEGNEGQGKALAAVISAGVQAEIVKQQRPGGLLNR